MTHLTRIAKGFHGANIDGHLVTVIGTKGAWTVTVDGTDLGTVENLTDAEITAELHVMVAR